MSIKVATDHGWPKASDGSDANAFDAFKNERDYIAQSGKHKTTVAAMDWANRELTRLSSDLARAQEALNKEECDAESHGCQRCWSDDLGSPCTCEAERSFIRSMVRRIRAAIAPQTVKP